ncbi:MAG: DUF2459 domain-containing protein [Rhodanobacteraceae bacterium]
MVRNLMLWVLLAAAAVATSGCARMTVQPPERPGAKVLPVLLMSNGWHTQLALPAADVSGHLAVFRHAFPAARWLAFGWGERTFFMTPHPNLGDTLRAIFPAPSALLVSGLVQAPELGQDVLRVYVSHEGLAHLSQYLWGYVGTSPQGAPRQLGAGPQPMSAFYASSGTYDVFHTCNTWSAAALRAAGVPIRYKGVYFAAQVTDQVRRLEHARRADHGVTAVAAGE